ncbi:MULTISPECIES: hypothetical protein [unclassified Deinococcus]|uniref:hypothetical protein n=1 Tax=unclassified Deinococcus TaxID=2623546 RepID=UPI001C309F88|nr:MULTISPECIES: hypothetical protein [unclassified Deinococcus]MDK2012201.1 hypothetical protein [Deinococcus sp. 43]
MITHVTQTSIGVRLCPNNPFFKLLTKLSQQPESTYASLVAFTRTYLDSLGRAPSDGDTAYWQALIVKSGVNYADILRAAGERVLSAGNEAVFAAMIRRAFRLSGWPQPGWSRSSRCA